MRAVLGTVLAVACLASPAGEAGKQPEKRDPQRWLALFNGKNLEGWQVVGGEWKVEEGVIGGAGSEEGKTAHLVSDATFDNFILHARFRSEGGTGWLGFRGDLKKDSFNGLRLGVGPGKESGFGSVDGGVPSQSPAKLEAQLPPDAWIDCEIVCAGERIRASFNGIPLMDFIASGSANGRLALMASPGGNGPLLWKDIRVLPLYPDQDFRPLFEGNDLNNGWFQIGEERWSARNGVITGETAKGGYGWLVTDREYQDFILNFRYRWTSGNSGVQFRSWLVGGEEMHGLQADIDPSIPQMTGMLYDEHERATLAKSPPKVDESYDKELWHNYEISAIGEDIRLYHDGLLTVHFTETDPKRIAKGLIALQVHSAPKDQGVKVEWKDLRILNLEPPSPWE